jgi:hypothetical protein
MQRPGRAAQIAIVWQGQRLPRSAPVGLYISSILNMEGLTISLAKATVKGEGVERELKWSEIKV